MGPQMSHSMMCHIAQLTLLMLVYE